jgi:hypothetical protein
MYQEGRSMRRLNLGIWIMAVFGLGLGCVGCNLPAEPAEVESVNGSLEAPATSSATVKASLGPIHTLTPSVTASRTDAPVMTYTAWPTHTILPSATSSPTITPTATITPSPTFAFPRITVSMQANCRYGPGTAYLYAHGMYSGDGGTVWGRNYSGTWLWIQPDNITYQCWIAASVVEIEGDIFTLSVAPVRLPHSPYYYPPENVEARREGDTVLVTWSRVPMTDDDFRGYLMEVTVCLNGNLVWMAVHTNELFYTFPDETSCDSDSGGLLYAVEKHGYTDPVDIPWP